MRLELAQIAYLKVDLCNRPQLAGMRPWVGSLIE